MGVRDILAHPLVYSFWQWAIGDYKLRKIYIRDFVRPKGGDRILDIGCGAANMLKYLGKEVSYVGFDESQAYINYSKKCCPGHTFFCQKVNFAKNFEEKFDIIMANAILHHIDDSEALALAAFAKNNLAPGGRLITHDGCYIKGQPFINRWLLDNDRGQYVRTKEAYENILSSAFSSVKATLRDDLYNIPYSSVIFECTLE